MSLFPLPTLETCSGVSNDSIPAGGPLLTFSHWKCRPREYGSHQPGKHREGLTSTDLLSDRTTLNPGALSVVLRFRFVCSILVWALNAWQIEPGIDPLEMKGGAIREGAPHLCGSLTHPSIWSISSLLFIQSMGELSACSARILNPRLNKIQPFDE